MGTTYCRLFNLYSCYPNPNPNHHSRSISNPNSNINTNDRVLLNDEELHIVRLLQDDGILHDEGVVTMNFNNSNH